MNMRNPLLKTKTNIFLLVICIIFLLYFFSYTFVGGKRNIAILFILL